MTYPVEEMKRAVHALDSGAFRHSIQPALTLGTNERWDRPPRVVAVLGAGHGVGATTVATAIADAAGDQARLIETAAMHASGLASATTTELGETEHGWRRGARADVLVERTTTCLGHPTEVPIPETTDRALTVVDIGWDPTTVLATDSWIADLINMVPIVVVATATIPGLRSLDAVLDLIGRDDATCVVIGPRRRRWPQPLDRAVPPRVARAEDEGRLVVVPKDRTLELRGLDGDPLPSSIAFAAAPIAASMLDPGHDTTLAIAQTGAI